MLAYGSHAASWVCARQGRRSLRLVVDCLFAPMTYPCIDQPNNRWAVGYAEIIAERLLTMVRLGKSLGDSCLGIPVKFEQIGSRYRCARNRSRSHERSRYIASRMGLSARCMASLLRHVLLCAAGHELCVMPNSSHGRIAALPWMAHGRSAPGGWRIELPRSGFHRHTEPGLRWPSCLSRSTGKRQRALRMPCQTG